MKKELSDGTVVLMLFIGVVLFSSLAIGVQALLPAHDVLLQHLFSLSTGFSGALFTKIRSGGTSNIDASGKSVEVNIEPKKDQ